MEVYREKIDLLGFEFFPLRPDVDPEKDRELAREIMDAKGGTEKLLREILLPNVRQMYEDLTKAVEGADCFDFRRSRFRRRFGRRKNKNKMDYDKSCARVFSFAVRSVCAADGAVAQTFPFSRRDVSQRNLFTRSSDG